MEYDDFNYLYLNYPSPSDLFHVLQEYRFLGSCREFLINNFSKRFKKIPTTEILRIYDHCVFSQEFQDEDDRLANEVSIFLVGQTIPPCNASVQEKRSYIDKLKKYFDSLGVNNDIETPIGDLQEDLHARLLKLYARNLKTQKILTESVPNSRIYLLNVVRAIMRIEEPCNNIESSIWYQKVKNQEIITESFLKKFYKIAIDKIKRVETQIASFRKTIL